jgi:hypothetical protein
MIFLMNPPMRILSCRNPLPKINVKFFIVKYFLIIIAAVGAFSSELAQAQGLVLVMNG